MSDAPSPPPQNASAAPRPDFPLLRLLPPADSSAGDGDLLDRFLRYTSEKGLVLYPAQEEAILAIFEGQNVILNTPTGSGKSLVALASHFYALSRGQRSFYTCPIKALVTEKFIALCHDFGPDSVGMITGDATVNADAPIICCTAEILANMALRDGAACPADDVIMDEFHYYSDRERGVAWQVPLLTLPRARFMLMSATLGDVSVFEEGLTRLTGRETTVVRSAERPVPLTFIYQETPLHETVQNLVSHGKAPVYMVAFTQAECADAVQNLMSVDICSREEKQRISAALLATGVRFTSPYGKEIQKFVKHGVGLHHAGLLPKYRRVMERLAQGGLLKVICGTDTLGVGINIPIRTVLFTKLCKYDGEKSTILSVRDFQQIAGRAGRKGFDTQGLVVAQAPEHVIENQRIEAKAAGDPKKFRKIVRKKPPIRGFVMWTKDTFEKLVSSNPEPLMSRFQVSHGMLLNVLSRSGDGCRAMRDLVRSSHETPPAKERLRRLAFQMFRALVDRRIIEFKDGGLAANVDLQEDFSIHHVLALYLMDTVKHLDPYAADYSLDVLTLAESIVEDPDLILRKQLSKLKSERMAELKAQGVEFDDRIAELELMEYPKPRREFIYETFNEFAATHPWIGQENIRPKSIARQMYEEFMTFPEYVREFELQRSEGLLLRYLGEVYRVLVHTVPAYCKDDELTMIIDFFGAMVRQVDSTLLDEWERFRNPDWQAPAEAAKETVRENYDITKNRREFTVSIRNEVFQYVKALGGRRLDWLVEAQKEIKALEGAAGDGDGSGSGAAAAGAKRESVGAPTWTVEALREIYDAYRVDHDGPLTKRSAADTKLMAVTPSESDENLLHVQHTLLDVGGINDWVLEFIVDVPASSAAGKPILHLMSLAPS